MVAPVRPIPPVRGSREDELEKRIAELEKKLQSAETNLVIANQMVNKAYDQGYEAAFKHRAG